MKPTTNNHYTGWNFNAATPVTDRYMTLINRDYVFEFVDHQYCSILGRCRDEVLNNTVKDIWGSENFDNKIKQCIDRCFAGIPVNYEGWFDVPGNGQKRYYKIHYFPYKSEDGNTTHVISALWDITDAKQEEEIFSKCKSDFFRKLQKNSFGVILFDMKGQFLFVNNAMVEITGFDCKWFADKTLFDFIRPEEKDNLSYCFSSCLKGRDMHNFVFSYNNAFGEINWINANFAPIYENGATSGVVCVVYDVTRRKEIERRYDNLQRKYNVLFENCNDAIFTFDSSGRLTHTNKRFLSILGYKKEDINDTNIGNIFTEWKNPDGLIEALKSNRMIKRYETTIKKKDGTIINTCLTIVPLYNDNKTGLLYQGLFNDITQFKLMEKALLNYKAQLESIICESPIPQFMIDKDHRVIYWNKALETIRGITSREMVGTKNHWKAFYEYERPCMADLVVDGTDIDINKWYHKKEYKTNPLGFHKAMDFFKTFGVGGKWLYFSAVPVRDANGDIIGAIEILEDATDSKIAEETIRLAEQKCIDILRAVNHEM